MNMTMFDSGIYTTIIAILGTCLWLLPNPIGALLCFLGIVITAVLFLTYLTADFFAAVILLIYAGAIVVLLSFIIMFISFDEKNTTKIQKSSRLFLLMCLFVCVIVQKIFVQLFSDKLFKFLAVHPKDINYNEIARFESLTSNRITHIYHLSELYTQFYFILILLGLALLLAMFGAIYLTRNKSRY